MKRLLIRFVIALSISVTLIYVSLLDTVVFKYLSAAAFGWMTGRCSAAIAEWIYGDKALKYEPQGK